MSTFRTRLSAIKERAASTASRRWEKVRNNLETLQSREAASVESLERTLDDALKLQKQAMLYPLKLATAWHRAALDALPKASPRAASK
jgi:hypothetical protein